MTGTTHPEFGHDTEALDVAKAFADGIRGKTILITGVNLKGIGFSTAEAFASQSPAHLILAGRNPSKIEECIAALRKLYSDVDYRALELDLASQRAVRAGAQRLLSMADISTIDIVINSAAVMLLPKRTINEDGLEMQFATNHLGHFLFTSLIMPRLVSASSSSNKKPKGATRVINVTSLSPTVAGMRWSDITFEKPNETLPANEQPPYHMHRAWGEVDPEKSSYLPLEGYNQSKVANVLFSIGLNARVYETHGILSFAVHPGVISTELSRNAKEETLQAIRELDQSGVIQRKTLGAGSSTALVAALDPALGLPRSEVIPPAGGADGEEEEGSGGLLRSEAVKAADRERGATEQENVGVFFVDCQVSTLADPRAIGSNEAERLWELSEKLVGEKFAW